MRKLIWFAFAAMMLLAIIYAINVVAINNRATTAPTESELRVSYEKSIGWMLTHRTQILASSNTMLWWMVMRSAELTRDPRLHSLFAEYKERQMDHDRIGVWRHWFSRHSPTPVIFTDIAHYPDYNLFFVYAAACDAELAELDIIKRQQEAQFCSDVHPISPACVTHQLMGARMMLERGCGEPQAVSALISTLQDKVVGQLTWDPRVVDVYLQRVLMLADTGAMARIKPIWLRRILDAQRPDGGWGQMQALVPLPSNRAIGFNARGLGVGTVESDFHATAQGVLLLSLVHDATQKGHTEDSFDS